MIRRSEGRVRAPRSGRWPLLGVAMASMAVAACSTDSLLQLPDPDIIGSEIVTDTANLPILRNGVQFEFAQAYAGPATNNADPGIVGQSGVLSDELWYASTFPTLREIDGRRIDVANGDVATVFRYVHRARNLAERAAELYATTSQANGADHATMVNYAGFTYVFFAENYCSGVPFSTSPFSGELTFGGPNTTAEILDSAAHRFTAALAMSDPTQQNV